ncbi:MAG: outer-membrane lipoprotein carrier protein LolA, partial [Deltaproteobacteria bacterium]|nr:outer-membrane lipoprotein carrier protein LolA [Deltaproteobacteria bacterium]
KLLNSFHIEQSNGEFARKGLHTLKLTPKKMEPNIDKAYLLVAEETFDVVELITYNTFGDETRIRFSGLRFNLGLDPSLFEFKIPENADVLQLQTGDQP